MDTIIVEGPDGAEVEFPAGTPPETIKQAMAKRYPKPAAPASPPQPAASMAPPMSRPEAFMRGVNRGVSFATMDEQAGMRAERENMGVGGKAINFAGNYGPSAPVLRAADAIAGTFRDVAGMTGDTFETARDEVRAADTAAQTQHPVTTFAGEVAGSAVVPGSASARFGTKGGQIIVGAAEGGLMSGVYGAAAADGDLKDRAEQGLMGLGAGAVFGGSLAAVLPRNVPLGEVLNAELFGAKVSRPALKTIERILRDQGLSGDMVNQGLSNIRNRLQEVQGSATLPTRFKDELVKEFGEFASGLRDELETQIRGAALKSGSAADSAVRDVVRTDNDAAWRVLQRSLSENMGDEARVDIRGASVTRMREELGQRYEDLLAGARRLPAEANQAMAGILQGPGMEALRQPLKTIAAGEGLDLDQFIMRHPFKAAHWMQSAAGNIARSQSDPVMSRAMGSLRRRILETLEESVPGYRETRMEYGDEHGIQEAVKFAQGLFAGAKDPLAVADMADQFMGMSPAQQKMALASLRDKVAGSAGRVRETDAGVGAPRVAEISKADVLDALETIVGDPGRALADDIRKIAGRLDENQRINPFSGSNTFPNAKAAERAAQNTMGPFQRFRSNVLSGIPTDFGVSMLAGMPAPAATARAGLQAVSAAGQGRTRTVLDEVANLLLTPARRSGEDLPPIRPTTPGGPPPALMAEGSNPLALMSRGDMAAGAAGGAVGAGTEYATTGEVSPEGIAMGAAGGFAAKRGVQAYQRGLDQSVRRSVATQAPSAQTANPARAEQIARLRALSELGDNEIRTIQQMDALGVSPDEIAQRVRRTRTHVDAALEQQASRSLGDAEEIAQLRGVLDRVSP